MDLSDQTKADLTCISVWPKTVCAMSGMTTIGLSVSPISMRGKRS
jgi:hypothetical protein